jgi:hypothetical protein
MPIEVAPHHNGISKLGCVHCKLKGASWGGSVYQRKPVLAPVRIVVEHDGVPLKTPVFNE